MPAEKGSTFLLKVGDGAATPVFTTVAGLRTTQLSINGERTFASGDLVEAEAFGFGDSQPVTASAYMRALTITPPAPVHGEIRMTPDGGVAARWIRRSRIDNGWNDGVDQIMAEEAELYRVRLFADSNLIGEWVRSVPNLVLTGDEMSFEGAPPKPVLTAEVVQIGRFAPSKPLHLWPS